MRIGKPELFMYTLLVFALGMIAATVAARFDYGSWADGQSHPGIIAFMLAAAGILVLACASQFTAIAARLRGEVND